jgi:hypothetical protein
MLVWTQCVPGTKEEPILDLWHRVLDSDRRSKLVVALFVGVFIVASCLFKPGINANAPLSSVLVFLGILLLSKFCNISIKEFSFDLEPAAILASLYLIPKRSFELKTQTEASLESMVKILSPKEGDSNKLERIGIFTKILAEEMGMTPEEHVQIIPLLFPSMEHYSKIVKAAMLHHEWFDGSGYPFGLKGHEIPLEARIIAVASAWDAMIYPKCYRNALSEEEALQTLLDGAGIQWDPRVVHALLKAYETGKLGKNQEIAA